MKCSLIVDRYRPCRWTYRQTIYSEKHYCFKDALSLFYLPCTIIPEFTPDKSVVCADDCQPFTTEAYVNMLMVAMAEFPGKIQAMSNMTHSE